jgi:glycosyltransferase involved in cell wall biosynthesis
VNEPAGILASPVLVSIIIPCRNEQRHIERFLSSAQAQDTNGLSVEYLVADGMSDDGTREILQRLEDGGQTPQVGRERVKVGSQWSDLRFLRSPLRVIDNPGRIVSMGLNAAIRAARGNIIIRMDAHTEYAPDYVQQCIAVLHGSDADNVGGPARTRAETYLQKAVAAAYHSHFAVGGARFHDVDYEGWVDTVTYGCWRRQTFEKFGCFDEELVRNQDDEHNLRIIRGGGKIWQSPKIKSWYKPRGSLSALFRQYMQYGYWKVRVIQKHKLPASWRHLVPGTFVLTLMLLFLLSAFCFLLSALTTDHRPLTTDLCLLSSGLFTLTLGSYALALLVASVVTAAKSEWKLLPVLPLVFPCYHFGYGYGFLRGIWSFVICRKTPGEWAARLTRSK